MKNIIILTILSCCLINPAYSCDFDGDGVDEALSYDTSSGSMVWNYFQSSDGTSQSITFGDADAYPAPGSYLGAGNNTLPAVIDSQFFWQVLKPDMSIDDINFGRLDASYMTGKDFNGDGVTDNVKFVNRCNKLTKSCNRNRVRGNFFLVDSDGTDTFIKLTSTTATGLFGKGLFPLFAMDADNDGADDVCYAFNLKRKPKTFKVVCKNLAGDKLKVQKVGRLFNKPLSLKRSGEGSSFVLWKAQARKSSTLVNIFRESGDKIVASIPSIGTVLTGDWLDDGDSSEQVAVATGGVLSIYNPVDGTLSSKFMSTGTPLDCNNNLWGNREAKILTTRNVCKVVDCN